ncbi:MAG: hypothetical protein JWR26_187 [Pedosphaera sp.]|nr:hypothetical protein [Pedosphaera sp.]
MKVVLQSKVSLLYFKDGATWVPGWTNARNFGTSLTAMDFCRSHRLEHVQVVLKFADEKYDITLQILESRKAIKSSRKHA